MNLITKNAVIHRRAAGGTVSVNVDGDIIVPDVKPDILKLLQVDGQAVVLNTELADGTLSIEGRVDLKILYIPDREQEKINSILTSFDFSHKIDKSEITGDMICDVTADVEKLDFQVLNSRKLKIRAVTELCFTVSAPCIAEIPVALEEADADTVQVRKKDVSLCHVTDCSARDFALKESIELPSGQNSIATVLKVDVAIRDKEYKVVSGRIVTKAMCNVCALYLDNNGEIRFTEAEIPFTEIFDVPDAEETTKCDLDFLVKEVLYEPSPDSDGDIRILNLEFMLCAKIFASEVVEAEMIEDCFVPGMETVPSYCEVELDDVKASASTRLTLRETAAPQKGSPAVKGIYNVAAKTHIRSMRPEMDKVAVEGSVYCYILYLSESEDSPVYSFMKNIPFTCLLEAPGSRPNMECDMKAEAVHVSYSLTAAGEAEIRCVLSLEAKVLQRETLRLMESISVSPVDKSDKKGIVIYFVQPEDTLWDVARRYRVSIDAIKKLNGLEDTEPQPGCRLVIPGA